MTRIALVSTSDTDLLSARASGADYVYVNPTKAAHTEMAEVFAAADLIVARILGSRRSRSAPASPGSAARASRWWSSAASRRPTPR